MKHQLSGELLKFRTTRSPYVAAAAAGAFAALIPTLASADPQRFGVAPLTTASLTDLLRAPGHVVAAAALLVGILAAAGEHTHRTILTSRLAEPDPTRILAAKVLAAAIVGAVIAAVAELIALAVGVVGLRLNDIAVTPFEPANVGAALTVVLAAAVACVVGTGLGALVRSTAAALGIAMVWVFAIENMIPVLAGRADSVTWLPGQALDAVLAPQSGTLSTGAGWILMLAYGAALLALTATADRRRDV